MGPSVVPAPSGRTYSGWTTPGEGDAGGGHSAKPGTGREGLKEPLEGDRRHFVQEDERFPRAAAPCAEVDPGRRRRAGLALVAIQLPSVARWDAPELFAWVGLTAVTALLEQFTVRIAHRSEVENYSLTDAFWVPALIFAPGERAHPVGVGAGIVIGQTTRRWK